MAKIGLTMVDLMPAREEWPGSRAPHIVAEYDYRDERGMFLYQVVRRAPKDFRVRRPDGQGRWIWNLGEQRRVLYMLPELLAADSVAPVFIAEGEKDVDKLRRLGLIATTNPGGAGKWRPEFSESLRGRHAVILPDNDEPGRKHAEAVALTLRGVAASVLVVELSDLPPKGDVSDWLAAGGTAAALLELAAVDMVPGREPGADDEEPEGQLAKPAMAQPTLTQGDLVQPVPAGGTRSGKGEALAWPAAANEHAYHGLAGRLVETIDPHTEADRVAILAQLLVAFGNAIGRGPHFAVEASRHYPNLNVVLVGETAKGRKGTSWQHVLRLMQEADEGWSRDRIISGLSSGEGLIWGVRDPTEKKDPIKDGEEITGYRNKIVDEGVSDKRALIVESEFARVLRVAMRDGNTLSTTVREAWDSIKLQTLTKNSPTVATDPHISIIGHITKDELLRSLSETEMANGFANRFLWVCVRRSKVLPEGGGALDLGPVVRDLKGALSFARKLGERALLRDPAAREIWHGVYLELSTGRPGLAGAVLGRAEAQVMRLALVYALLDRAEMIGASHLRAALSFWEYVEQSVRHVFGDASGDRVADDILLALRASPAGMTRTELSNLFGRHVNADRLGAALQLLQRAGRAFARTEVTLGRSAERWYCEKSERSEKSGPAGDLVSLNSLTSQGEVANGSVP